MESKAICSPLPQSYFRVFRTVYAKLPLSNKTVTFQASKSSKEGKLLSVGVKTPTALILNM